MDMDRREWSAWRRLVALMVIVGVYPGPILELINSMAPMRDCFW